MSSLADQIRTRHLGSETEGLTDGSANSADSGNGGDGDVKTRAASASVAANTSGKPTLKLSDLPQLGRGSGSRASAAPRRWGATAGSAAAGAAPAHAARAAPASAGASAAGPRIGGNKASVLSVTLQVPDKRSIVMDAVRAVSSEFGVKIEIANSVAAAHNNFMIKGSSQESTQAAREALERALQPHESQTVEIPSSARAALIGPRGASLRALENKHKVSVELSGPQSQSPWSLERTQVTVSGPASSVQQAVSEVLGVVNPERQLTSTRALPPGTFELVLYHPILGKYVRQAKAQLALQGTFNEVIKQMKLTDEFLDEAASTYERSALTGELVPIPEQLQREVYAETGCVVISNREVYGPPASVDEATKKLNKFLQTQTHLRLDIAQAHGRDTAHAKVLARYFAAKGEVARIAKDFAGVTISPEPEITESSVVYSFVGDEKTATKARAALKKAVIARTPSSLCVIRGMRHPIVRKRAESSISSIEGPVSAFIGPSDELFLEYEEPEDDFAPSEEDIARFVAQARQQLAPLTELASSLARKKLVFSEQDAQLVLKPRGPEANELWNSVKTDEVELEVGGTEDDKTTIVLSGVKSAIAAAADALPKVVSLSRHYLLKSSHVEEFNVDASLVRQLIGRGGKQIQKFRDDFDVKVEVDEAGHVRVQGVQAQAKACAKAISEFNRKVRDEVTEQLQIPVSFHAKLIGPKGKHVKRLSEQHNCIIRFPKSKGSQSQSQSRSQSAEPEDDTASLTSESSEESIYIRGPSRGVAAIKREFTDLVNYERAQSHSESMSVPSAIVSRLVGRGGVAINTIRQNTGAQIDVGKSSETDAESEVEVVVRGEQRAVKAALEQLRKAKDAALDFTEKALDVPAKFHRFISSQRREFVAEAGGDAENAHKIVTVLSRGGADGAGGVRLTGPSAVVAKLEAKIQGLVAEKERVSQVTGELSVPRNRLRRIVGSEGSKVREVEQKNDVIIEVPRGRGPENEVVKVLVSGERQQNVDAALEYLRDLALPEENVVNVWQAVWTPQLRSHLSSNFKVHAIPITGEATPLEVPPQPTGTDFVLLKSPELEVRIASKNAEEGAKAVEYLKQFADSDTIGYIWIPAEQTRLVVGQKGKTIKKIRTNSKCSIEVPSYSSGNDPISIVGTKTNVLAAKDAILEAAKA